MSVARTPQALVLDVESCNQLVGCPGCGVIAHGHGRVVVEVIDAPSAGVPARIRCHKRRWICREHTCETVTFLERSDKVCAPINTQGKPRARTNPDATLSSGGGIALHGGPTRRRHATRRPRVVKKPHHCRHGGSRSASDTRAQCQSARQSSPSTALQRPFREKSRPARTKTPNLGCFERAGRTFSRFRDDTVPQGELFRAQMKPPPPLLPPSRVRMKPATPLLARNAAKTHISGEQRRRRFHPRTKTGMQR